VLRKSAFFWQVACELLRFPVEGFARILRGDGRFDREEGAYGQGLDIPSQAEQSPAAVMVRRRCGPACLGIWAVVTYVWPAHKGPTAVCADQGIAIGGNVSGSKMNNQISGGTGTAAPCVTIPKK
jgi:hypothetical protein